ncbi:hypothetical protein NEUTE1DRAFT_135819 [Neurospora tetrasperma FGSC 2508]|uniref:Uncharacterized protein n=1 Tax=Neurospora tetrasperma (strain FGSC 2508 / ATCC MYA-4615 / P0657) TaxID=510951 RepID=F8MH00_NEUT8|nr:uncharacterized protein NEUTE1DRAFT_135819 [Neurospora tetrasperma FGSC 2508]EGO58719.1 hypothetical protein NEUTE1DRAFT_135819 [Neurospora tetrasperma FGSC 2508]
MYQPQFNLSLPPLPRVSIYQQAHAQVLKKIGPTPDLSAEERILYIMDLIRCSICSRLGMMPLCLNRPGPVASEHVQVAIMSLGQPKVWKSEREKWMGFAEENLGVQVTERVIVAQDTEMTERMTSDELVKKGGEGVMIGNTKGKSPAKRLDGDKKEGGNKVEEDEEAEEAGRIS